LFDISAKHEDIIAPAIASTPDLDYSAFHPFIEVQASILWLVPWACLVGAGHEWANHDRTARVLDLQNSILLRGKLAAVYVELSH
jgi:hypothetical protein